MRLPDKGVRGLGLADPMLGALGDRALVFDAVEADPSAATALAAVAAGREAGVTSVIGFGGGSPMDVAKVVAYLLGSGDDLDAITGGLAVLFEPYTSVIDVVDVDLTVRGLTIIDERNRL